MEFHVHKVVSKNLDILSIKVSHVFPPKKKGGKPVRKSITIADSCKLIPGSLDNLTDGYKVETLKGYFPYDYVNKDNLEYVGLIPDYEYYIDPKKGEMISLKE